jgi:glycosyltransferase involved in cell wall biosynthesis
VQNKVSVVHFSTGHAGGAGIAARRLNQKLVDLGVSSFFYALENPAYNPSEFEGCITRSLRQKLLSGITARVQKKFSERTFFSILSLNILNSKEITKYVTKNDILHFHNWFNLTNQKTILKLVNLGYKVVVTMHDERFYTGGCHYSLDCIKFEQDCKKCPELPLILRSIPSQNLSQVSKKVFPASNLVFIAPSNWILDRAARSEMLGGTKIVFIPNTLSDWPQIKAPYIQEISKSKKVVIGIASMNHKSYIKGWDTIQSLEKLVSAEHKYLDIIYLNQFDSSVKSVKDFWQKIDYLLVPSKADNSPNVIHEAKSLGIPVIASMVGGIPELLDEAFDIGINPNQMSGQTIIDRIFLREKQITDKSVIVMLDNFSNYVSHSVLDHLKLYENMQVINRR